jgi:HEAT repeat protein
VSSFTGSPTSARVYAFRLAPDGAGFSFVAETTAVQGILTVGMRFGPDGALYLADWIDGWASKGTGRIWKVNAPGAASPAAAEVRSLLAAGAAGRPAGELRALLGHADMRVRLEAQFELVRRADADALLAAARGDARAATEDATRGGADGGRRARVHGIWGLGQLGRADARHAAGLAALLGDADPEVRAQAAKALGDVRYVPAADALVPLLGDSAPRARFFAAEALGRIGHPAAVPGIVRMLADNDDRDAWLRQAGATALARIGDTASVAAAAAHPSRGARLAAVVALRRMRSPEVARFLDDADDAVATEAARAANDETGIDGARPALARALEQARATGAPLVRRAISANLRLGTPEALERLAAFAARADRGDTLRAEAVAALGTWPAPSTFDRVDGAYLGPVPPRDTVAARAAVARLAAALRDDAPPCWRSPSSTRSGACAPRRRRRCCARVCAPPGRRRCASPPSARCATSAPPTWSRRCGPRSPTATRRSARRRCACSPRSGSPRRRRRGCSPRSRRRGRWRSSRARSPRWAR